MHVDRVGENIWLNTAWKNKYTGERYRRRWKENSEAGTTQRLGSTI
jgi:hypothetical protein